MNINQIPTPELLFDRQECFNDIVGCLVAKGAGVSHYSGGSVDERLQNNLAMIETIRLECVRRGFDPVMYKGE